jgi:glycosyltransferase involved in cell wall biosynthesis
MRDAGQFEPLILTSEWSATNPIFEQIHGIRNVRWQVRPYSRGMGIKEKISYFLWERRFRAQFARFCSEQNVKVVNIHYPGGMAFTFDRLLRSRADHLPLLLSFHGTDVSNLANASDEEKREWKALLKRVHGTVACSGDLAKRICKAIGDDLECHIIYSGVDVEKFVTQGAGSSATGGTVVLNVGKFDYNKGQHLLIEAFAVIAVEFPKALLHLVGGNGAHLNSLRDLAAKTGLGDRIQFFVDIAPEDMPAHFAHADFFAFPSYSEGCGLVLLEAAAFALPIVASRVGGVPELIDDGVTGLLIEAGDTAALVHALRRLMSEPSAAKQLGDRMHQRVRDDFSWLNTMQQYEAITGIHHQRTVPPTLKRGELAPVSE